MEKRDATGKNGLHPLQRVVAAIRMLAYGIAADAIDEYVQISDDSVLISLKGFCKAVVEIGSSTICFCRSI